MTDKMFLFHKHVVARKRVHSFIFLNLKMQYKLYFKIQIMFIVILYLFITRIKTFNAKIIYIYLNVPTLNNFTNLCPN